MTNNFGPYYSGTARPANRVGPRQWKAEVWLVRRDTDEIVQKLEGLGGTQVSAMTAGLEKAKIAAAGLSRPASTSLKWAGRAKYSSLAGLGYKNSCGHEIYYLADWGDKVSVIQGFWEDGNPFEGQRFYYSLDARNLRRRHSLGTTSEFSQWGEREGPLEWPGSQRNIATK